MPEFTVKEVRLPELHLPELRRDEIIRALSGIHVPEVDLAKVEPRRRLRDVNLRALSWGRSAMVGADAGRVLAAVVTAARTARPAQDRRRWSPFRRSRWSAVKRSRDNLVAVVRPAPRRWGRRVAVFIALAAAVGWMLVRSPAFRSRLDRTATDVRRRIEAMRGQAMTGTELDTGEPVSITTAETTPGAIAESTAAGMDVAASEEAVNPA
jgi:hypothetical protein